MDVLLESVEQVVQQGSGQREVPDAAGQRVEHSLPLPGGAAAREHVLQIGPVGGQLLQPKADRRIPFVSDVVRSAREVVNRGHGGPQGRRTQPGRHRKVFVVIDAHDVDCRYAPKARISRVAALTPERGRIYSTDQSVSNLNPIRHASFDDCADPEASRMKSSPTALRAAVVAPLLVVLLAACSRPEPAPPPIRAVRTMTVSADSAGGVNEFAADVRART